MNSNSKEMKRIIDVFKKPIGEGFFDRFKTNPKTNPILFKQTPNTWTHTTYSEDLINQLKSGGNFIGNKEDLTKFNIPNKGPFATFVNQHSPNFKKGSIFQGFEQHPYLITTELPDEAFQPNWNSRNYDNFEDSQNVGVLKPQYRDSKNFKLWKKNKDNQFELIQ
jgi:hypothetical protein